MSTQELSLYIIAIAFAATVIATQMIRRRRQAFPMRVIPAYESLPLMIGAAIEANRPIHMSAGSAGLGQNNTVLALANAELFYRVAQQAAIGATSPIITTSDPTAIPLGQDTLRRAFESRDLLGNYQASSVRWYPQGVRSLAFAAGVTAMLGIDRVNANVLVGSFGPELALITEAAARRDQSLIAASSDLTGQAIAYATSDRPLIGEEIFAAGAYLGDSASQKAALVALDLLRGLLIVGLILIAIANANPELRQTFGNILSSIFGGR